MLLMLPLMLPLVVLIGVLGLRWMYLQTRSGQPTTSQDGPYRLLTVALGWLPRRRTEWGQAMLAELGGVTARWARWQFAIGCSVAAARMVVTLSRPPAVVAALIIAVAAATGVGVGWPVPQLRLFAVLLAVGMAVGGLVAWPRWQAGPVRAVTPWLALRSMVVLGVAGSVALTVYAVERFPGVGYDPTHLFSVVFGVAASVYLWLAMRPARSLMSRRTRVTATIAALACALVWAGGAVAAHLAGRSLSGQTLPVVASVVIASVVVASVVIGGVAAGLAGGIRAGVITGVWLGPISALALFTTGMTGTIIDTRPADIDAANTVGDNLGWLIMLLVLLPPVAMFLAAISATAAHATRNYLRQTR